ncbi:MAG TPA: hypothetical protein VHZ28_09010 [Terracidiphilus sp.]|jgi:molybdopterin converting factor small subunit|nr:hypothetical protein [Terracidiphilus sp.]
MSYFTRVLSKDEEFPPLDELAQWVQTEYPDYKLTLEEGEEGEWQTLLLSGNDEVEVAVLERNPVSDGSVGQDEVADFIEDTQDCKPESGVQWLHEYLAEVKTLYAFQHLEGADTEEGGNVLHALRSKLWERGDAILQADNEGFTNEEGFHIVWQFSDSVSGPWNMAVLQDGVWLQFKMDLGDPDHREAFLSGEMPSDLSTIRVTGPQS